MREGQERLWAELPNYRNPWLSRELGETLPFCAPMCCCPGTSAGLLPLTPSGEFVAASHIGGLNLHVEYDVAFGGSESATACDELGAKTRNPAELSSLQYWLATAWVKSCHWRRKLVDAIEVGSGARAQLFPLSGQRVTIGRLDENDLVFSQDVTVSRRHAVLERFNNGWRIRDLGSSNGTFVNGIKATTPMQVNPGDRVLVGSASFTMLRSHLLRASWRRCKRQAATRPPNSLNARQRSFDSSPKGAPTPNSLSACRSA